MHFNLPPFEDNMRDSSSKLTSVVALIALATDSKARENLIVEFSDEIAPLELDEARLKVSCKLCSRSWAWKKDWKKAIRRHKLTSSHRRRLIVSLTGGKSNEQVARIASQFDAGLRSPCGCETIFSRKSSVDRHLKNCPKLASKAAAQIERPSGGRKIGDHDEKLMAGPSSSGFSRGLPPHTTTSAEASRDILRSVATTSPPPPMPARVVTPGPLYTQYPPLFILYKPCISARYSVSAPLYQSHPASGRPRYPNPAGSMSDSWPAGPSVVYLDPFQAVHPPHPMADGQYTQPPGQNMNTCTADHRITGLQPEGQRFPSTLATSVTVTSAIHSADTGPSSLSSTSSDDNQPGDLVDDSIWDWVHC